MALRCRGAALMRRALQCRLGTQRQLSLKARPFPASSTIVRQHLGVSTERLLSTTASTAQETKDTGEKKKDDDSNIFLDNLGKIFLGAIGLLIGTLVRSSYGTTNRNNVRDKVETTAALDPLEIDDLRVANSQLTPQVFRAIMTDVRETFPHGTASYRDFVACVRKTMCRLKGDAFTVELGHLLDRAVIAALKEQGKQEDEQVPLPFLLAALSMALNSDVSDRITLLFESMQLQKDTVTFQDVLGMVGALQDTCQLVPDAQVIMGKTKYPTQQYERGTPEQLVNWEGGSQDVMDLESFHDIITSRSVCAWGECYVKKKKTPSSVK